MWNGLEQSGTLDTDLAPNSLEQTGTLDTDLGRNSREQGGTLDIDLEVAQWVAIEALVAGSTASAAAQSAGVGRTTLYRWFADPRFAAALSEAKREHLARIHASMRTLADQAVAVLGESIRSESTGLANRTLLAFRVLKAVGADVPEKLGEG